MDSAYLLTEYTPVVYLIDWLSMYFISGSSGLVLFVKEVMESIELLWGAARDDRLLIKSIHPDGVIN